VLLPAYLDALGGLAIQRHHAYNAGVADGESADVGAPSWCPFAGKRYSWERLDNG